MLKRYKNAFVEAIRKAGLNAVDFKAVEFQDSDFPALEITYVPGGMEFVVRNSPTDAHQFDYGFRGFPPSGGSIQYYPDDGFADFKRVLESFQYWLTKHVKVAIEEEMLPDFWADLEQTQLGKESTPAEFTDEEKKKITLAISNFRLLIVQNFTPDDDQLQAINEQLAYLSSSVARLNRFDWKGCAISTLLGIVTTLTLDTERGRQLYGLFQQAFGSLTYLLR